MKTMQVRVLRAFYYKGEPVKPGATLEVSATFGAELLAGHKAEAVPEKAAPETKEPEKGKGARNAQ